MHIKSQIKSVNEISPSICFLLQALNKTVKHPLSLYYYQFVLLSIFVLKYCAREMEYISWDNLHGPVSQWSEVPLLCVIPPHSFPMFG